jgi:uncharacterized membrane protein YphA (DoxX/SURF4 family)
MFAHGVSGTQNVGTKPFHQTVPPNRSTKPFHQKHSAKPFRVAFHTTRTYLAAAAELAGAAGLTLGFLTRLSALSLFSTMGLAVYFHIAQTGLEGRVVGLPIPGVRFYMDRTG